jgi:glutamine synthetase
MSDLTENLPPEAADFISRHPETRSLDAIFPDLSGVIRGKRFPMTEFASVMTNGLAFPASVFMLDAMGHSHDPAGIGFTDGDPDCVAKVIPGSLLPVPWAEQPSAQAMVTFFEPDGSPYPFEPRNILQSVLKRLKDMGLHPVVAFELEFYLFDRQRGEGGVPQPPVSPLTGLRDDATQVYGMDALDSFADVMEDISAACTAQGVRTGAITAEYAPGQFEINLHHLDDAMMAADHCTLFKRAVKGVARRHGFQASFMAKPFLDQAGSGLHMHISLLDDEGRNVFDGGEESPASPTLKHAIGGVLEILPEAMAFLAPNINSFRRYVPDIFVPIRRSWDFENRSVAVRIPLGDGAARRIEHRVAGADANPYLALASALAGIHHGLTHECDPGAPSKGNAGHAYDPDLAFRPRAALNRLGQNPLLAGYFGADYLKAYIACKQSELEAFDGSISRVEYEWYLQAD